MAVKIKSVAGRVSALALALSALALPATAQAQEEGGRFRDREAAGNIAGDSAPQRAPRPAPAEGGWSRPARTQAPAAAPQAAPAGDYQQGRAAQAPGWNRSAERREGNGARHPVTQTFSVEAVEGDPKGVVGALPHDRGVGA
ncbi:MAG: hypothetical protein RL339_2478, partial [Pseudomonadota bacterium]